MTFQKLVFPICAVAVVFVGFGDQILPNPMKGYSVQVRTNLGHFATGLIPQLKPQKPDSQTEKAVNGLKP